nr:hypothetical protein [uncultured Shinella sp.]
MATFDNTRRSPVTPVRNTFPERAAVSPAVRKPIAAHPYRTVIGTLIKDESRLFLKNSEIFFMDGKAAQTRQDMSAFNDHHMPLLQAPLEHLPECGQTPKFSTVRLPDFRRVDAPAGLSAPSDGAQEVDFSIRTRRLPL